MLRSLASGQWTIGELAAPFSMSFAGAAKHVRVLEVAGLPLEPNNTPIAQLLVDRASRRRCGWAFENRLSPILLVLYNTR
jgi:hypothetical protein